MGTMRAPTRRCRVLFLLLSAIFTFSTLIQAANTFSTGDVFISLSNGNVEWRRASGALVRTLVTGHSGQAKGMGFDSAGNLYVAIHWSDDLSSGNTVVRFDNRGNRIGDFGSGFFCNPHDVTIDAGDNVFVGQADCDTRILKFNSAGAFQASFAAATEVRGTSWIELAADQCTMLYTSQGPSVLRFNVCTNTQMTNFFSGSLPELQETRLLPDGRLLVAAGDRILLLDAAGNIANTFAQGSNRIWLSVDVDADGRTFWALDWMNSTVARFDLSTGAMISSFTTSSQGFHSKALRVFRGGRDQGARGKMWMTGGGFIFTDAGVKVTHGFVVNCTAGGHPGDNFQINWDGGNKFHLTSLTSRTCLDSPNINPHPPAANFDTFIGTGVGKFNGQDGWLIEFRLTDAGEPGRNDTWSLTIRQTSSSTPVLEVTEPKTLSGGNHQAHGK